MRACAFAALLLAAARPAVPEAQPASPAVAVDEPRAYGWMVGDTVERTVRLALPAGFSIDAASLPQPGRRGKPLELRHVAWRQGRELWLEYQVMQSPPQPRVFEMPAFELRVLDAAGQPQALKVEAWPVGVVPLAAADAPSRRGFGELQPDTPPPPLPTDGFGARFIAYAAAALLLGAYLVHVYVALPWWARRHRPFGTAWLALKALPPAPDTAQRRAGWQQVHAALNRSAGRTVFEADLDGFVRDHPRYRPVRAELQRFFERSRAAFFAEAQGDAATDWPWLLALLRRLRDLERGTAA